MQGASHVEGAARGANHSALMDLSVGSHRNDLQVKALKDGKLRGTVGMHGDLGNNHNSQTSLRSQRSGYKRAGRQHLGHGPGRTQ